MTTTAPIARRLTLLAAVALLALAIASALSTADASAAHRKPRAHAAVPHTKKVIKRRRHRAGKTPAASGQDRFDTGTSPQTMGQWELDTLNIVHRFWVQAGAGSDVRINWTNETGTNPCGKVVWDSPGYCSGDDTIYFSEEFARRLWLGQLTPSSGAGAPGHGDFGLAVAIAHEYAHNIQFALRGGFYEDANGTGMPTELEADCLAGVWANDAYYERRLDATDVAEAADTMASVGDYNTTDPGHHGTPAERQAAFMQGYNTGDGRGCTRSYLGF